MWTLKRIGTLIEEKFSVHLAPSSVWRLLAGWAGACGGRRVGRASATRARSAAGKPRGGPPCARDFGELRHHASSRLRSMQRRSTLVTAFWRQAELF